MAPRAGFLTAVQIDAVFRLRRQDQQKWTVKALAEHFNVDREQLARVLSVSSGPVIKSQDGRLLAYWFRDDDVQNNK